jgi:complex iron-sulfur molybdoenzyme family reductase subunit gamma
LSQVGKIATYGYLRDSILKPNEVVVRNLNQNRHYMKTEANNGQRGYPNNAGMMWYIKDEKGDVLSKMPSFDYLAPEDVANLLAFLKAVEK